jgi:transcriptional regulator with XRE-family HTH domain
MKLRVSLGNVIRARRAKIGFSQESFADKVGLHRTYMGDIERGERNLSLNNLVRVADALDIRLSQLIAEAEKAVKSEGSRR